MRSKTYNLENPEVYRRYVKIFSFGVLFYCLLVFAAALVLGQYSTKQNGQLSANEIYNSGAFSNSLDLRYALKNNYPSSNISVVENLGLNYGVAEKIVSFNVPVNALKEYGLMMLPSTPKPELGYPVIILCHGYTSPSRYKTTTGYVQDMAFYAQHGFAVIKPDYRGQGRSKQQGKPDSAYYSMDYNNDVMSLISAVKKTSYLDSSSINLWGHSMGAYIALRAAVISPDVKNVVLLAGPLGSLNKMYLTYIPSSDENNLDALKTRQEVFNKYGTPAEDTVFWKNASPINFVKDISAHIQIHQGSLDTIVPPEFSADLDKSLNSQNVQHEYYVYPDGLHSLADQRPLIWVRSLKLLELQSQS
jgi:dipeptidyl aminopeptidase/acylaminoacyl peptidase